MLSVHLGPGIQLLRACRISTFLKFCILQYISVYQWGVLHHEYRVESIYGLCSYCLTMAASIVSESDDTLHEAVSFSLS